MHLKPTASSELRSPAINTQRVMGSVLSCLTRDVEGSAWFWRNESLSDLTLRLVLQDPDVPETAKTSEMVELSVHPRTAANASPKQAPASVTVLPVHKVILAAASPGYWRQRICDWLPANDSSPAGQPPILDEHCTSEELPACLAVLEYVYTNHLQCNDFVQLCQMIAKADYWNMPACLAACKHQIIALSSSTMARGDAISLINLLPERFFSDSDGIHLKDSLIAALISAFGSVRTTIVTDSWKEQFCSLSFHVLTIWAGLEQLVVDSENSVAVLLTFWYKHQVAMGATPSEDQCKQLSGLVRLVHLSPSFLLQVLEHIPWWRLPTGMGAGFAACMVLMQLPGCPGQVNPSLANTQQAAMPARQPDTGPGRLEWQVSLAQLQRAFGSGELMFSPRLYWAGWEWDCVVQWRDKKDVPGSKTLGMFTRVLPPKCLSFKEVAATAKVTMCSHTSFKVYNTGFRSYEGWGPTDMLDLSVTDVKAGLANRMEAEQLHLAISVSKVQ